MSKLTKLAAAMPFAHFLGLPVAASARVEEEDDRKQREDESDEDYAKRMEEQDKKDEEARKAEEEKRDESARADDDSDDADMEDGDEEDKKDDKEEGKRAGRAKGARQRERIRCARIMAAGIKAGRVNQAAVFAFDTSLSASQAISALGASDLDKPKGRTGLGDRMSTVTAPVVTPQAEAPAADDPRAIAQRAIAAAARVRGESA
ncbi:hypothetical protein [Burkholderia ambifaria]|uniref:hypothetical protein n=1 Tax=Burkholderia ambifaria TaxID=152480 RepID=UPI001B94F922|nr:hypothetical protein [Burkholderia ambifaria]MBR8221298.1 hypothetical protein [Burkholderia ambifaria]